MGDTRLILFDIHKVMVQSSGDTLNGFDLTSWPGAFVTAAGALAVAVLTAVVAILIELSRHRAARRAFHVQEIRNRTAEAFSLMFTLQHEIEWITWHATKAPEFVGQGMVDSYNKAVHVTYPKLLGALAVVAALDKGLFDRLSPIARHLYELDMEVALAARGLEGRRTRKKSLEGLKNHYPAAKALYDAFPHLMASTLSDESAGSRRTRFLVCHARR
ncbi:hypothetical protein QFZ23_004316 [Arthrobacter globiformis]|uniref:hypothetical protein n=1 Tax=Arthrobacter globiformis TaxID=1665 RepID=UPI0027877F7C|nr:hypothetical protein [Arthrobacter globiformis]MDQ1060415.1 hypothetical protein [Arthrobacter globiformis]